MGLALYFGWRLGSDDRTVFLPGATSDGHYQIENACGACHGDAFTDRDAMQAKCEGCHAAALDEARDAHPQSKFTDPRNADRVALLDARYCVACHVEHEPERTLAMGLTLPADFCALCHQNIGEERPSHAGMAYTTCASSGCHNFHDNRALYEDFLTKHLDEQPLLDKRALPTRNFASVAPHIEGYPDGEYPLRALSPADHDAPASVASEPVVLDEWSASAHAANGVNCTACHARAGGEWRDRPDHSSCADCHTSEVNGFLEGKHGMRLNVAANGVELAPMRPELARLPMRSPPAAESLGCGSCHAAHRYDTKRAAVDACLGCHADEHSLAYENSPHGSARQHAQSGEAAAEPSVTCATCHLPRTNKSYEWGAYVHVLVQHNQNDNLEPNDKMLRSVCMQCHGLGFSIDALADPALIRSNFKGPPTVHVESLDLAARRMLEAERRRNAAGADR